MTSSNNTTDFIEVQGEVISSTRVPSQEELDQEAFIQVQEKIKQSQLPDYAVSFLLLISDISQVNLGWVIFFLKPIYSAIHFIVSWSLRIIGCVFTLSILFTISCLVFARFTQKKFYSFIDHISLKKDIDVKVENQTPYNININIAKV